MSGQESAGGEPSADPGELTLLCRVALSRLAESGNRDVAALVGRYGPVAALFRILDGADGRVERVLRARLRPGDVLAGAGDDVARHQRLGGRVLVPEDAEWPHTLLDGLSDLAEAEDAGVEPPLCLWIRGPHHLGEISAQAVAVIGARAATPYGTHVAGELGYGLAEREWTVVSGGAYGIDAAAHRGALAAGGVTIAVLASGADTPYPLGHVALFDRIAEEGLLVSEWPPGATPQRHRFLIRNRLVAALAAGTVVVEAAGRSGTTSTVDRACGLGRAVMAVPGPVTSAMSVGTHRLVRDAGARLVASAAHVVEEVGPIGAGLDLATGGEGPASAPSRDALDPILVKVLEAVPAGRPATVAQIAADGALSSSAVRRSLPVLVMRGFVEQVPGGFRLAAGARAGGARPVAPPSLR